MDDIEEIKKLLIRITNAVESISNYLTESNLQIKKVNKNINNLSVKSDSKAIESNDFSEIEDFLKSKKIIVKSVKKEDEADEVLDKISIFMGKRYSNIKTLYNNIKRN